MPNPVKTSDLVQKGLMNEPIKDLKAFDKLLEKVIATLKKTSTELQTTFKKADFKSTNGIKDFKGSLKQLSEVEREYQRALKQRETIQAKMFVQGGKLGQQNERLKEQSTIKNDRSAFSFTLE